MTDQLSLGTEDQRAQGKPQGQVECLGMLFESEEARREHFLSILADRLKDPSFRSQAGFPIGETEDILRMSDPPYYTACPNPFLEDFIRVYGRPYVPTEPYHRDPFAVDVSVGKTDALYKAHSYHTKVPHLPIVPSILHYTQPGDLVLDGFCGSGMTGVAAQYCGSAPVDYRMKIESEFAAQGLEAPVWGARRAILGDLSPAATVIAATYNIPFNVEDFEREAQRILREVNADLGWMYETLHSDGKTSGRINFTVWSEVFSCPECGGEIVFYDAAFDEESGKVTDDFSCPECGASLTKRRCDRVFTVEDDLRLGTTVRRQKRSPVLIDYRIGRSRYQKRPDDRDLDAMRRAEAVAPLGVAPTVGFPFSEMWEAPRLKRYGIEHAHQLFTPKNLAFIEALWARAQRVEDAAVRHNLQAWLDSHFANLSLLNRYRPGVSFPYNPLSGTLYIGSVVSEPDPVVAYSNKIDRISAAIKGTRAVQEHGSVVSTGDCAALPGCADSVDYVFTDPPFGANFAYWELNYETECWYGVRTRNEQEAAVDGSKEDATAQKSIGDYFALMHACFSRYYYLLKPSRWMTVVFSNSSNAVWRAIQDALSSAGFVVADVRTLDKQQHTFKQVNGPAVKQDLIISAYKPSAGLSERVRVESSSAQVAWAFVSEHLANVPLVLESGAQLDTVAERTPQMLHDRMVGFFVQRGLGVPLSTAEFMAGLAQRYPERDGMYLLPEQIASYDKRRAKAGSVQQLSLMVSDEASAIQWLRQQLEEKPQSFSDLQPVFMREAQQSWAKHEAQVELKELLEENFLLYDGRGAVPSQIKSYLSSNWREYRSLESEDPSLQSKAKNRWYVPDPGKSADLEKLRERQLLKEFDEYRSSTARKIKLFRTEAVRVGFKRAYDERDWETIAAVAGRLPESVVQEDEKLLMYYDVARMRVG